MKHVKTAFKLIHKLSRIGIMEGPGITTIGAYCSCGEQWPGGWNDIKDTVIQHIKEHRPKDRVSLRVLGREE